MKKSEILLVITFALLGLSGCNEKNESGVQPVLSILLSETSYTFNVVGNTLLLNATVSPSYATNPTIMWQSSNVEVATVSSRGFEGLVECTGFGDAIITASADGKSATCMISVIPISVKKITLSKTSHLFTGNDQTLQLIVSVSPCDATYKDVTWASSNTSVATVSDDGLVTCVGYGNATITATADGESAECIIAADDGTVTDACGNKYKYVIIGDQAWMAENMRCEKYDVLSENPNGKVDKFSYEDPKESTESPYCVDASEKRNWKSEEYSTDLLLEKIEKLGYLYNWAAAVGLNTAKEAEAQKTPFSGNRQGICPNGWHLPTETEWKILEDFCGRSVYHLGEWLKSKSGWWCSRDVLGNGNDFYSFTALPAGVANGSTVLRVGWKTYCWTATPAQIVQQAYARYMEMPSEACHPKSCEKASAVSVRCVKD